MKNQKVRYFDYVIEEGLLKIYYPFRFRNYSGKIGSIILKGIQQSSLCITEEKYEENGINIYLKKEFVEKILKCNEVRKYFIQEQKRINNCSNAFPEVVAASAAIKMNVLGRIQKDNDDIVYNGFIDKQLQCIGKEVEKLNHGRDMYGLKGVTGKQLLFLAPVICETNDGIWASISITCNMFFNGSGILVVDLPLENIPIAPFLELEYKKIYKKLISLADEHNGYKCVDKGQVWLDCIANEYIEKIAEITGYEIDKYDCFHMLLIGSFANFEHLEQNISYEFKEVIYRFLCAPVYSEKVTHQELDNLLKESKFGLLTAQYYFSEGARGIAFSTLEGNEVELKLLGLDAGMMLPVEVCLLDKINYDSTLEKARKFNVNNIEQIKTQYLSNETFILGLRSQCRGTAHKMIDFMRKRLKYYLNTELFNDEYRNINEILVMRKNSVNEKLTIAISYLGFLIASVFSLPMIFDTVSVLRDVLKVYNIPYITVEGTATCIWTIFLALSGCFFGKHIKNKPIKIRKVKFLLNSQKNCADINENVKINPNKDLK